MTALDLLQKITEATEAMSRGEVELAIQLGNEYLEMRRQYVQQKKAQEGNPLRFCGLSIEGTSERKRKKLEVSMPSVRDSTPRSDGSH